MSQRSRNWCFTLNNYTEKEYDLLIGCDCNYVVIGKEVGESGTPHLQGYIEFPNAKRLDTLKNMSQKIHWECRKGTSTQAADYCKKDKNFEERGEISRQGSRTDLNEIGSRILSGASVQEIMEENPGAYIKFSRGIQALKNSTLSHRSEKPTVNWIWGRTGIGKTRSVYDKHGADNIYMKANTKWWDGYNQEEVILIDDIDPAKWNTRELLKLLDRYKYDGEVKGGTVKINSPHIYITCDKPPNEFWSGHIQEQILRRIDNVVNMKCDTNVTEVGGNTKPPQSEKPKVEIKTESGMREIKSTHSKLPLRKFNFT